MTVIIPIINTMVPDRNISWAIRALNNNGPSVGKLITMETIMLPETKVGKRYPRVLITGFKATLNAVSYTHLTLPTILNV